MKIPASELIIPDYFTPPRLYKIERATMHYQQGTMYPLQVEKVEGGWLLCDGYARYMAALSSGATEFEAITEPIEYRPRKKEENKRAKELRQAAHQALMDEATRKKEAKLAERNARIAKREAKLATMTPEELERKEKKHKRNVRKRQAKKRAKLRKKETAD